MYKQTKNIKNIEDCELGNTKELDNLYKEPEIIDNQKSTRISWTGYVWIT